jgi:hypothetical protein
VKKPAFPSKPCPKCEKLIPARSKSHEECGWVEASTPVSKPKAKPATAASNGEKLSKMEAVRRVLKEHGKDTMPVDIQDHLKKQYSIKMDAGVISNYKSSILKARKKGGRPKAKAAAGTTNGISLDDIRAVKHLADRLGADKVKELASVLA